MRTINISYYLFFYQFLNSFLKMYSAVNHIFLTFILNVLPPEIHTMLYYFVLSIVGFSLLLVYLLYFGISNFNKFFQSRKHSYFVQMCLLISLFQNPN